MRNLHELDQFRVNTALFPGDDHTGAFRVHVCGRSFNVIASIDGLPGEPRYEHVSVTPASDKAKRCPTWEEMCAIKDLFFKPEEECLQFHPAKSRYVNIHPYCLHIWRKVDDPAFAPPMPWEMATIADRDRKLEELWDELGGVPFDDDEPTGSDMKLAEDWNGFPKGTERDEIWHWFDRRYSKGVVHLLYCRGNPASKQFTSLYERSKLCIECDSETCAYNPEGVCILPFGTGEMPFISEDGCDCYCMKGKEE